MRRVATDFSLPNVGSGPDPFSLAALPARIRFVVLLFQRDYYCTNCRNQIQEITNRLGEFHDWNAEVVSIVPEPVHRVKEWQARYGLTYPLLADPEASVGGDYGQPVRFGIIGEMSDFLGRMPQVVIVDRRTDPPEVAYIHRGKSTFDRPTIDDLLTELDSLHGCS